MNGFVTAFAGSDLGRCATQALWRAMLLGAACAGTSLLHAQEDPAAPAPAVTAPAATTPEATAPAEPPSTEAPAATEPSPTEPAAPPVSPTATATATETATVAEPATTVSVVSVPPEFSYPLALAAGPTGAVYVADRNLPGIWRIHNGLITKAFEGSKKFRTPLNAVRFLAFDREGRLLAADSATRDIYRFPADDAANTGSLGTPEPLTKGLIGIPMAIVVQSDGSIIASDLEIQRIVKIPPAGGEPVELAVIAAVRGLAVDSQDRLWVAHHGEDQVLRLSRDGSSREVVVSNRPFNFSHHLTLASDEEGYLADGYSKAIWQIRVGQPPTKVLEGAPLDNPVGVTRLNEALLIADPRAKAIFRWTASEGLSPLAR